MENGIIQYNDIPIDSDKKYYWSQDNYNINKGIGFVSEIKSNNYYFYGTKEEHKNYLQELSRIFGKLVIQ